MKKLKTISLKLSLFFFAIIPIKVFALGDYYISGTSVINPGNSSELIVGVKVNSSSLNAASGYISNSNDGCVKINSIISVNGTNVKGNSFIYANMNGGATGNVSLLKISVTASGQSCQSVIKVNDAAVGYSDGGSSTKLATYTVNVTAPLSTNNNLASLNINQGSLSPGFNANTTNYNVTVESNVSSINISASVADSKASLSGTGNKNLNYGKNTYNIVVKAQNGNTKTYTINVTRKDTRSSDATLKQIRLTNVNSDINFNKDKTDYNLSVPYEITKLNIDAIPNDSKSKISITNPDLISEETQQVVLKVTAENGNTKTYTINVSRQKDPNKVLNTDNNLISLSSSIGMLSPVFDSNKTNYFIYLPYEVENITFNYEVSDKRYASVEVIGEDRLKPDTGNKYLFNVKAEDESIKTYTVTVFRAKNPEEEITKSIDSPITTQLKELKITNGKLNQKFDPNVYSYTYKKKDGFKIDYELMEESSFVNVYEEDNNIYIVVEDELGNMTVYCLHLLETDYKVIALTASTIIFAVISLLLIIDKFFKEKILKNKKKKTKKTSTSK